MKIRKRSPLFDIGSIDDALVAQAGTCREFHVLFNDAGETLELLIHSDIGDTWEETDSKSVAAILAEHRDKTVNARINSYGGLVFDGIAIYNAFAQHPSHVTATIEGVAASAASVLAMGADKVRIAENASFMLHNASGLAWGNASLMDDMANTLRKIDEQLVTTYAARTGLSRNKLADMMEGDVDGTWLSGKEAVDMGFADELIKAKGKGKSTKNFSQAAAEHVMDEIKRAQLAEGRQRMAAARLRMIELDGHDLEAA